MEFCYSRSGHRKYKKLISTVDSNAVMDVPLQNEWVTSSTFLGLQITPKYAKWAIIAHILVLIYLDNELPIYEASSDIKKKSITGHRKRWYCITWIKTSKCECFNEYTLAFFLTFCINSFSRHWILSSYKK